MAAREAVARADALLKEKLSPEQRAEYERTQSFLVVTPAGRRYRLHADRVNFQADLLAPDSEYVLARYCVQPRNSLVPKSDSLLAQMLLLQADEALFLLTANADLKVSSLPRYLSGEIRPPSRDPSPPVAHRRTVVVSQREQTAEQIFRDYRCAVHNEPVVSMADSDDGRGWRVRYACDCPTHYVSRRAHEERQQSLSASPPPDRTHFTSPEEHQRLLGGGNSQTIVYHTAVPPREDMRQWFGSGEDIPLRMFPQDFGGR